MAIEFPPPELAWVEWVAGARIPVGNEDYAESMAERFRKLQNRIVEAELAAIDEAIHELRSAYPEGAGADAIGKGLKNLRKDAENLAKGFGNLAEGIHSFGGEIYKAKLNGIIGLAWLAGELMWAWVMGPGGQFAEAAAISAARTFFRMIAERLTTAISAIVSRFISNAAVSLVVSRGLYEAVQEAFVELFQGTTQEVGVQSAAIAQGYQDGYDGSAIALNAAISSIAGATGGITGFGMHHAVRHLPWAPDRWGGMARGAITGAVAGAAGALGAWGATGLLTGEWTLDPRMITGGVLGGIGPSMIYGWRGGSDYSGAPMTTDDYRRVVIGRQGSMPDVSPVGDGTAAGSSTPAGGPRASAASTTVDSTVGTTPGTAAGVKSDAVAGDSAAHSNSDAGEGVGRISKPVSGQEGRNTGGDIGRARQLSGEADPAQSAVSDSGTADGADAGRATLSSSEIARAGMPAGAGSAATDSTGGGTADGIAGSAADLVGDHAPVVSGDTGDGSVVDGGAATAVAPTSAVSDTTGGVVATGTTTSTVPATAAAAPDAGAGAARGATGVGASSSVAGGGAGSRSGAAGSGASPATPAGTTATPTRARSDTGASAGRAGASASDVSAGIGADVGITAGYADTAAPRTDASRSDAAVASDGDETVPVGPLSEDSEQGAAGGVDTDAEDASSPTGQTVPDGDTAIRDEETVSSPDVDARSEVDTSSDADTRSQDDASDRPETDDSVEPHHQRDPAGAPAGPDTDESVGDPDGSADLDDSTDTDRTNQCGPETLAAAAARHPNAGIREVGHVGLGGMTAQDFQSSAGGRLVQAGSGRGTTPRQEAWRLRSAATREHERLTEMGGQVRSRARTRAGLRTRRVSSAELRLRRAQERLANGQSIDPVLQRQLDRIAEQRGQRPEEVLDQRIRQMTSTSAERLRAERSAAERQAEQLQERARAERDRLLALAARRRQLPRSQWREVPDRARLLEELEELGEGGSIIVVDQLHETDEHGVNGHSFLLYLDHGVAVVEDSASGGGPRRFDPTERADIDRTWVIKIRADDSFVDPLAAGAGANDDEAEAELNDLRLGEQWRRIRTRLQHGLDALRAEHSRARDELADAARRAGVEAQDLAALLDPSRYADAVDRLGGPALDDSVPVDELHSVLEAREELRAAVRRYHDLEQMLGSFADLTQPRSEVDPERAIPALAHATAVSVWLSALDDVRAVAGHLPQAQLRRLLSADEYVRELQLLQGDPGVPRDLDAVVRRYHVMEERMRIAQRHVPPAPTVDPRALLARDPLPEESARLAAGASVLLRRAMTDLTEQRDTALAELRSAAANFPEISSDRLVRRSFQEELDRLAGSQTAQARVLTAATHYYHELADMVAQISVLLDELRDRQRHSPEWITAAARYAAVLPGWGDAVRAVRDAVADRVDDARLSKVIRRAQAAIDPIVSTWEELGRETLDLGSVVGVSERGPHRIGNQDVMAADVVVVDGTPIRFGIVADGVSRSADGGRAASVAAAAARESLRKELGEHVSGTPIDRVGLVRRAIDAAQQAVMELAEREYASILARAQDLLAQNPNARDVRMPPQTTIALVLVEPGRDGQPGRYAAGWVGDSRVDVLDPTAPDRSRTVTFDHSVAGMVMASDARAVGVGHVVDEAAAYAVAGAGGGAIQSALGFGPDGGGPPKPHYRHHQYLTEGEVSETDILLVRTDGLGNARRQAPRLAQAFADHVGDPSTALTELVDGVLRARSDEGRSIDNMTGVAVLCAPTAEARAPEPGTRAPMASSNEVPLRTGRNGSVEVPPGLRIVYRMLLAEQRSAAAMLRRLTESSPVDPAALTGADRHAALDTLVRSLAGRPDIVPQERERLLEQVRYTVERYRRAHDRLRALDERISAHGGGVDAVRARPRPVAPEDPGYSTRQHRLALQHQRTVLRQGESARTIAEAWQWTDREIQRALIRVMPERVAETVGLPLGVRDEARRLLLRRVDDRLRRRTDPNPDERAALDFWLNLAAAAERWTAQVPGHPAVRLLGSNGALMVIGDLDTAREIRFHAVPRQTTTSSAELMRATAAAAYDAGSARPTASVVWFGADARTLARDAATLLDTRAGAGSPGVDVVLIGHDGTTASGRSDDETTVAVTGFELVHTARADNALSAYRDRLTIASPDQGVVAWRPTHRVDGLVGTCFIEAARSTVEAAIAARSSKPGIDPDTDPVLTQLRQRLELLRLLGPLDRGVDGGLGAHLVGADWRPNGFADFDEMLAAVPAEGGSLLAAVAFEGFQQRHTIGAHAVRIFRDRGRVMVAESGREPVEFDRWRRELSGVVGLHGIVVEPDGTAEISLGRDGWSRGKPGSAFPVAAMGARRDRAGPTDIDIGPALTRLLGAAESAAPGLLTSVRLRVEMHGQTWNPALGDPRSAARREWDAALVEARIRLAELSGVRAEALADPILVEQELADLRDRSGKSDELIAAEQEFHRRRDTTRLLHRYDRMVLRARRFAELRELLSAARLRAESGGDAEGLQRLTGYIRRLDRLAADLERLHTATREQSLPQERPSRAEFERLAREYDNARQFLGALLQTEVDPAWLTRNELDAELAHIPDGMDAEFVRERQRRAREFLVLRDRLERFRQLDETVMTARMLDELFDGQLAAAVGDPGRTPRRRRGVLGPELIRARHAATATRLRNALISLPGPDGGEIAPLTADGSTPTVGPAELAAWIGAREPLAARIAQEMRRLGLSEPTAEQLRGDFRELLRRVRAAGADETVVERLWLLRGYDIAIEQLERFLSASDRIHRIDELSRVLERVRTEQARATTRFRELRRALHRRAPADIVRLVGEGPDWLGAQWYAEMAEFARLAELDEASEPNRSRLSSAVRELVAAARAKEHWDKTTRRLVQRTEQLDDEAAALRLATERAARGEPDTAEVAALEQGLNEHLSAVLAEAEEWSRAAPAEAGPIGIVPARRSVPGPRSTTERLPAVGDGTAQVPPPVVNARQRGEDVPPLCATEVLWFAARVLGLSIDPPSLFNSASRLEDMSAREVAARSRAKWQVLSLEEMRALAAQGGIVLAAADHGTRGSHLIALYPQSALGKDGNAVLAEDADDTVWVHERGIDIEHDEPFDEWTPPHGEWFGIVFDIDGTPVAPLRAGEEPPAGPGPKGALGQRRPDDEGAAEPSRPLPDDTDPARTAVPPELVSLIREVLISGDLVSGDTGELWALLSAPTDHDRIVETARLRGRVAAELWDIAVRAGLHEELLNHYPQLLAVIGALPAREVASRVRAALWEEISHLRAVLSHTRDNAQRLRLERLIHADEVLIDLATTHAEQLIDGRELSVGLLSVEYLPDNAPDGSGETDGGRVQLRLVIGDPAAAETVIWFHPGAVVDQEMLKAAVGAAVDEAIEGTVAPQGEDSAGTRAVVVLIDYDFRGRNSQQVSWYDILDARHDTDVAGLVAQVAAANAAQEIRNAGARSVVVLSGAFDGADVIDAASRMPGMRAEFDGEPRTSRTVEVPAVRTYAEPTAETRRNAEAVLLALRTLADGPEPAAWRVARTVRAMSSLLGDAVRVAPEQLGNLAGIPLLLRHEATMRLFYEELRGPAQRFADRWKYLTDTQRAVLRLDRAARFLPGSPAVLVLSLDMAAYSGGELIVLGDFDRATRVTVLTAVGSRNPVPLDELGRHAVNAHQNVLRAARAQKPGEVVTVIWRGSDIGVLAEQLGGLLEPWVRDHIEKKGMNPQIKWQNYDADFRRADDPDLGVGLVRLALGALGVRIDLLHRLGREVGANRLTEALDPESELRATWREQLRSLRAQMARRLGVSVATLSDELLITQAISDLTAPIKRTDDEKEFLKLQEIHRLLTELARVESRIARLSSLEQALRDTRARADGALDTDEEFRRFVTTALRLDDLAQQLLPKLAEAGQRLRSEGAGKHADMTAYGLRPRRRRQTSESLARLALIYESSRLLLGFYRDEDPAAPISDGSATPADARSTSTRTDTPPDDGEPALDHDRYRAALIRQFEGARHLRELVAEVDAQDITTHLLSGLLDAGLAELDTAARARPPAPRPELGHNLLLLRGDNMAALARLWDGPDTGTQAEIGKQLHRIDAAARALRDAHRLRVTAKRRFLDQRREFVRRYPETADHLGWGPGLLDRLRALRLDTAGEYSGDPTRSALLGALIEAVADHDRAQDLFDRLDGRARRLDELAGLRRETDADLVEHIVRFEELLDLTGVSRDELGLAAQRADRARRLRTEQARRLLALLPPTQRVAAPAELTAAQVAALKPPPGRDAARAAQRFLRLAELVDTADAIAERTALLRRVDRLLDEGLSEMARATGAAADHGPRPGSPTREPVGPAHPRASADAPMPVVGDGVLLPELPAAEEVEHLRGDIPKICAADALWFLRVLGADVDPPSLFDRAVQLRGMQPLEIAVRARGNWHLGGFADIEQMRKRAARGEIVLGTVGYGVVGAHAFVLYRGPDGRVWVHERKGDVVVDLPFARWKPPSGKLFGIVFDEQRRPIDPLEPGATPLGAPDIDYPGVPVTGDHPEPRPGSALRRDRVRAALARAGLLDVGELVHPVGAPVDVAATQQQARRAAAFWDRTSLDDAGRAEREAFRTEYPEIFGELEAVPGAWRDTHNRERLGREFDLLRERSRAGELDEAGAARLRELGDIRHALEQADRAAQRMGVPARLLSYPGAAGTGLLVIEFGDRRAYAQHLIWYLPEHATNAGELADRVREAAHLARNENTPERRTATVLVARYGESAAGARATTVIGEEMVHRVVTTVAGRRFREPRLDGPTAEVVYRADARVIWESAADRLSGIASGRDLTSQGAARRPGDSGGARKRRRSDLWGRIGNVGRTVVASAARWLGAGPGESTPDGPLGADMVRMRHAARVGIRFPGSETDLSEESDDLATERSDSAAADVTRAVRIDRLEMVYYRLEVERGMGWPVGGPDDHSVENHARLQDELEVLRELAQTIDHYERQVAAQPDDEELLEQSRQELRAAVVEFDRVLDDTLRWARSVGVRTDFDGTGVELGPWLTGLMDDDARRRVRARQDALFHRRSENREDLAALYAERDREAEKLALLAGVPVETLSSEWVSRLADSLRRQHDLSETARSARACRDLDERIVLAAADTLSTERLGEIDRLRAELMRVQAQLDVIDDHFARIRERDRESLDEVGFRFTVQPTELTRLRELQHVADRLRGRAGIADAVSRVRLTLIELIELAERREQVLERQRGLQRSVRYLDTPAGEYIRLEEEVKRASEAIEASPLAMEYSWLTAVVENADRAHVERDRVGAALVAALGETTAAENGLSVPVPNSAQVHALMAARPELLTDPDLAVYATEFAQWDRVLDAFAVLDTARTRTERVLTALFTGLRDAVENEAPPDPVDYRRPDSAARRGDPDTSLWDATEAAYAAVGRTPPTPRTEGVGPAGVAARDAPRITGADWEPGGFGTFDELRRHVMATREVVIVAVVWNGLDGPFDLGMSVACVKRVGRDVVVVEKGREIPFHVWASRYGDVVDGLFGMALYPDGTPVHPLGLGGLSVAIAGPDFADTRIGAPPVGPDDRLPGYRAPRTPLPALDIEFTRIHRLAGARAWQYLWNQVDIAFDALMVSGRFTDIPPVARPAAERRVRLELIEKHWNRDIFAKFRDVVLYAMTDELAVVDLPDPIRDRVNRLRLARERAELRAAPPTEENTARLAELDAWADRLTIAEHWVTQVPGHPPVWLLGSGLLGDTGNPMIVIGDPRTAVTVDVLVTTRPGPPTRSVPDMVDADLIRTMAVVSRRATGEPFSVVLWHDRTGGTRTNIAEEIWLPPAAAVDDIIALLAVHDTTIPAPEPIFTEIRADAEDRHRRAISPLPDDPHLVVRIALEWVGMRDIRDLLPAADADPEALRRRAVANDEIWRSWPPYVRDIVLERHADVVARAPGLPMRLRDAANRALLSAELSASPADRVPGSTAGLEQIHRLLTDHRGSAVLLLSYAVSGDNREMIVAFSDPDTTARVHWAVFDVSSPKAALDLARSAFTDVDDGDTALVALVRGHGRQPIVPAEERARADATTVARVVIAHNAVRRQRAAYPHRPRTHLGNHPNVSAAVTVVPTEPGMAAEIDSAPSRSEWELGVALRLARSTREQMRRRIAELVARLRSDADPVPVAEIDLAPERILETVRRLATEATDSDRAVPLFDLFAEASRLVAADAQVRRLGEYLADRVTGPRPISETEATRELVAAQARRVVIGMRVLEGMRELVAEITGPMSSADRTDFVETLGLPTHPDELSANRLVDMVTVLLGRAISTDQITRITEFIAAVPELVIAEAEIREGRRWVRLEGLDTLVSQLDRAETELGLVRLDCLDHGLDPATFGPTTLREARARRAALHRQLAERLGVAGANLNDIYLAGRRKSLQISGDPQRITPLIRQYQEQRDRTGLIEAYLRTQYRHRRLLEQAHRLDTLVRLRSADADNEIRAILSDIAGRFEPVDPTAAVPDRPLHTGPSNCVPIALDRFLRFRVRRGGLTDMPEMPSAVTEPGPEGVTEEQVAARADADWRYFSSLDDLVAHVNRHGGAIAGAITYRHGRRVGGHMFEVEIDDDGRLVVYEWADGRERVFRGDEVRAWLRERNELGILRVHGIVVDEYGNAVIPYVAKDRIAADDDLPAVGLAGLPRDDRGPPGDSAERDVANRAALNAELEALRDEYYSPRASELDAMADALAVVDSQAAENGIGPVRLLDYSRAEDTERGRLVIEIGEPTTADIVIGYVAETATGAGSLLGQAASLVRYIGAERVRDSAALIAVFRLDDDLEATGRAPFTVDLAAADADALVGELSRVIRLCAESRRPPRIEIVGRGDGAAAASMVHEALPGSTARIDPVSTAQSSTFDLLRYPPLPAREQALADNLRRSFEQPESTSLDVRWLWSGLDAEQRRILLAGAAELIADLDGVAEADRAAAWIQLVAGSMWNRSQAVRLESLIACLSRAERLLGSPIDAGPFDGRWGVRPLALPVTSGTDARVFVLLGNLETRDHITVFVSATDPTPDALRVGLSDAVNYLAGQTRWAVAVWYGTDAGRLAQDLDRLAQDHPDVAVRLVVEGAGEQLVHDATADERMALHRDHIEIDRSGGMRSPLLDDDVLGSVLRELGIGNLSGPSVSAGVDIEPGTAAVRAQVLLPLPDPEVQHTAWDLWINTFGADDASAPDVFAAQFARLSRDERWTLVEGVPERIAERPGVPVRWRDRANRMVLARQLTALEAEEVAGVLTEADAERLALLRDRVSVLREAERIAATLPGHPPVQVLALGSGDGPRPARLIIAFGDPDTARRISVAVVGRLGSESPADGMNWARNAFGSHGTQTAITYLGADTDATTAGLALVGDIEDLMVTQRHHRRLETGRNMSGLEVIARPEGSDIAEAARAAAILLPFDIDLEWEISGITDPEGIVAYRSPDTHELPLLEHELEGEAANCTTYLIRAQRARWPHLNLVEPADVGPEGRDGDELAELLRADWHPHEFESDADGTAHDEIAEILLAMGPGATAAVVDEYVSIDSRPDVVGGHIREMFVAPDGTVKVRDWRRPNPLDREVTEVEEAHTWGVPAEGVHRTTAIFRHPGGTPTVSYDPNVRVEGAAPRTRVGSE
uniref:WXG100-like domain-containing protein n=1 Tax=Nocardia paucivorans TaxID=114259 RepID=UPI000593A369